MGTCGLNAIRWLDELAPETVAASASREERMQLRMVLGVALLCAGVGVGGALVSFLRGDLASTGITGIGILLWIVALPVLRWTRSTPLAAWCVVLGIGLVVALHSVLIWDEPLSLAFLFAVPFAALLLIGPGAGWAAAAITVASAWPLALWQAERLGPDAALPPSAVAWATFAFTAGVWGSAQLADALRRSTLAEAEAAQRHAEEAHEQLEEEQARFRALAHDSYQTICETDDHGIVLYANPRYEEVLGYRPAEIVGRQPFALLAGGHDEETQRPVGEVLKPGQRFQVANRHRDGHEIFQEVVASRYATREGDERWIFAGRDISREKAERERVLEMQKLEGLGVLAGGVAHDFNNLLTVISGYADELPDSLAAREIRRAAERAGVLTGSLLAFGRKQILQPRVTHLNDLLLELEPMLRSLVREDVRVELELAPEPWRVEIDLIQAQRVLVNLASNARDAMPGGGVLHLLTGRTHVGAREGATLGIRPGEYATLAVRDSGLGMDAATLERAFEPFFTTKGVGYGTGLGLASVYGIVEQSGGAVKLASKPGAGTEVLIFFPRSRREPDAPTRAPAPVRLTGHGDRVLVVEDDPNVRKLIQTSLGRWGFRVMLAEDGPAAVRLLREHEEPVDLLLTDVIMPEMRGPELAKRVQAMHPDARVLFMSGYDDSLLGEAVRESRDTRFIAKPFSGTDLVRAVTSALDPQAAASGYNPAASRSTAP